MALAFLWSSASGGPNYIDEFPTLQNQQIGFLALNKPIVLQRLSQLFKLLWF